MALAPIARNRPNKRDARSRPDRDSPSRPAEGAVGIGKPAGSMMCASTPRQARGENRTGILGDVRFIERNPHAEPPHCLCGYAAGNRPEERDICAVRPIWTLAHLRSLGKGANRTRRIAPLGSCPGSEVEFAAPVVPSRRSGASLRGSHRVLSLSPGFGHTERGKGPAP